ncbi:hypothetical protein ABPG75_000467 [Micractinium tetrahymenae]
MSSPSLQQEWGKGWDKIIQGQRELAKAKGFVHRKGPHDQLISKVVPLGLTAVGAVLCVRGIYSMILGISE